MTTTRDRLFPAFAAVVAVAVGLLMVVLLTDARDSGVEALEESLVGEVSAIARSQDQRVTGSLSGGAGLAKQPWELEVDSLVDLGLLNDLFQFFPNLRTGFFVTDADLVITQGVNLEDRSIIGDRADREGLAELFASDHFAAGAGGYLPIETGLTASIPTLAAAYPIIDTSTGSVRGSFVIETEVAADSNFNEEISKLGRGDTGEYLFYDGNGSVIAASDQSMIAGTVPDQRFIDSPAGLTTFDGKVVVFEDVPAAGWRIAFVQDRSEFQSGLAGPLQSVGRIIVIVFLGLGVLVFVLLDRRLRAAREEQERLRRLAESQEEFISIVSHELRTPVAGVLGFLQTSLDHWDSMSDEARRSAMSRSASNARRLQSLTRDVLDSQAAESGRMAFSMDAADLAEEVRIAVEAAGTLYPEHRFVLDAVDHAAVSADVDRIQQVLTNLLDNAARISPPTTTVEVRLTTEAGAAVVTVRDHGPGLPEGAEERVFEKFVRGHSAGVSGTGLGLYIARQIVDAHHGSITVESPPDGGALFTVRIPLSGPHPAG